MPRHQRIRSKNGYYHVMMRGNERKDIFLDEEDKQRFIEIIREKKLDCRFFLHAFCLMSNHIHLMLSEGTEDIAKVMKRISVSYVFYFNKKYKRVGHLFQDRFRSEVVDNDAYILSLARYIHQNPVKAGIVKKAGDYKWSSYSCYLEDKTYFSQILDTDLVLGIISSDKGKAKKLFESYMVEESNEVFIDIHQDKAVMDEDEARKLYANMLNEHTEGNTNEKKQVNEQLIRELRQQTNLPIRKIAEIVSLNKDKVNKILNSDKRTVPLS